jgi:predicted permease
MGPTVLIASIAMMGYVVLAGISLKWTLGTVKHISQGTDVNTAIVPAKDFSIKIRHPLLGYILKDLRVSSRNPATAFFFALPVLETTIVSLVITNFEVLKASTMLVAAFMGGIFSLLMPLALLNAEGAGLEYTKTLPVNANRIIISKALISTATYVPVPLVLLIMSLLKPLSSPFTTFIPFFTLLAIASASIFEIQLFFSTVAKGKIAALIHDLKKLITGVMTLMIPIAAYALGFLVSFSHVLAILSMAAGAFTELAIAISLLNRNKTNLNQ